uniref:Uncharacterized protein n=1 Tax=Arundo donax TaxID=35708 RepID=A0A0A9G2R1_ARUDO
MTEYSLQYNRDMRRNKRFNKQTNNRGKTNLLGEVKKFGTIVPPMELRRPVPVAIELKVDPGKPLGKAGRRCTWLEALKGNVIIQSATGCSRHFHAMPRHTRC